MNWSIVHLVIDGGSEFQILITWGGGGGGEGIECISPCWQLDKFLLVTSIVSKLLDVKIGGSTGMSMRPLMILNIMPDSTRCDPFLF